MAAEIRPETHPARTWTENQLSDLQLAEDLIDTMFSIATRRIHDEREKREPNASSIVELQQTRTQCEHDRKLLRWHMQDTAAMQTIISRYTQWVSRQRWAH